MKITDFTEDPIIRKPYELSAVGKDGKQYSFLYCKETDSAIPMVNGMALFTEARAVHHPVPLEEHLAAVHEICGQGNDAYEDFILQRGRRPYNDAYAAFQPFNEASKAFYPFIHYLRDKLEPGDIILDVWSRTGYSTAFLSAMFPEQEIVALWDSNKDVLGYKGYNFWFGSDRPKPPNVTVLFQSLDEPLPIQTDTVKLVYAMDTLHHFPVHIYVPELLRITAPDGVILFPHVHMANNEPEPFFDRGGDRIKGSDYDNLFHNMLPPQNRKHFVFSEPFLYQLENEQPFANMSDTEDYNGCVIILPEGDEPALKPYELDDRTISTSRVILNPFLQFDWSNGHIVLDRDHFQGSVGHIMDRHSVYCDSLEQNNDFPLEPDTIRLLFLADRGYTVEEIIARTELEASVVYGLLRDLRNREVLEVLPMSFQGFALQHYHSSQNYVYEPQQRTLKSLWERAVEKYSDRLLVAHAVDEAELTYADIDELVQLTARRLVQDGLSKGDQVLLWSYMDMEAVILSWACLLSGVTLVPVSPDWTGRQIELLLQDDAIVQSFIHPALESDALSGQYIVLDGAEETSSQTFTEWLEALEDAESPLSFAPDAEDIAVVLYTSGSSGRPKGVTLSHRALFSSGRNITETYHWAGSDRFYPVGDLDAMSALRNALIAPLHVGASLVLPDHRHRSNAMTMASSINDLKATVLSTTPALLRQWVQLGSRIGRELTSLRYVMCTGAALSNELITEMQDLFQIDVFNYYGLTETSGICIAQSTGHETRRDGSIGQAIDAVVQVIDEQGQLLPAGETGELRVFSDNLMSGYWNAPEITAKMIRSGWLYTGDLAMIDEDGHVFLKGRLREIIKTSRGDVLYLSEIEHFLMTADTVEDVCACYRTGAQGEEMIVFVVVRDAQTDISQTLKHFIQEGLGASRVPRTILPVATIAYFNNGKANKRKMLDQYAAN